MKNIKLGSIVAIALIYSLCAVSARAQLTHCNVFLQGNYVEVGINTNGAFGSSYAAPAGYHQRGGVNMQNTCDNNCSGTSTLGFVADAGHDGWATGTPAYFGDFFMPGSPQEGWSLEVNGVQSNAWNGNNAKCDSLGQFTGSLTGNNFSYSNNGKTRSGTWKGHNGDSIDITQVTSIDTGNLFFTINVTLKNTGTVTKNNVYYMRTVDPDNDQTLSGLFKTINSVAYQLPNANNRTLVTATGSLYTQAYLGLGTLDCRAKCFIVNATVKPTVNCHLLYSGSTTVTYSGGFTGDVGLGLVFNLGSIAPGDSVTLSYAYVLNASYLDIAFPTTPARFSVTGDTAVSHASGDTAHLCQHTLSTLNIVNGSNYTWTWVPITADTLTTLSGVTTQLTTHTSTIVLKAIGTPICTGPMDTITVILSPDKPLPDDPSASSSSPLCVGGTLNLTASSTTGSTYSWTGPSSFVSSLQNPSISGLTTAASGTYSVSATLNGCVSAHIGTTTATVHTLPVVGAISGGTTVCVGSTVAFSDTTAGGTWSSAAPTIALVGSAGVVTGVGAGSATISYSVTNVAGCTSVVTKTVTVNPLPTVSTILGTDSTCVGFSSTLTNGTPGGNWSSSDPGIVSIDSVSGVFTGVAVGTATVTYSVSNGTCSNNASTGALVNPVYTITTLPVANGTISPSGTINLCSSDSAIFTFTPNVGYFVSDVLVDGVSLGSMGTYTFSAIHAPHIIAVVMLPSCTPPSITSCPGTVTQNADAGICSSVVSYSPAIVTGTAPTITYSQNSGTSFAVGVTTVNVTAANGCGTDNCSFTVTVVDNQAPSITAPANVTVNADPGVCFAASVPLGTATGSDNCGIASITNNGTPPYVVGTTVVTWTVTDTHGNTATATQNVTVVDNQDPTIAAPANVTVDADPGSCFATSVSLGSPVVADNCDIAGTANDAPSSFPVGTTTVHWTVTDIHGNSATATQLVTVTPNILSVTATHTDVSCHGGNNATINTSVTGGTGTYTYLWTGGLAGANPVSVAAGTYTLTVTDAGCSGEAPASVTVTIADPPLLTASASAGSISCHGGTTTVTVTGSGGTGMLTGTGTFTVTAGSYTYTVTDSKGCTAIASITVGEPGMLSVGGTVSNVSCYGGSDGSISTTVAGGTPGYTYLWSTGALTSGITGSPAGTYSVTVTDSHGCAASGSYTITQPTVFSVSGTVANVNCYGGSDGSISTTVAGGTPGYTYLWNTGALTSGISARPAGSYSVTVTDSHGCTATGSFTITQPAVALSVSGSVTNVSCYGGNDGAVSTTVSGGTPGYTYLWSTGATTSGITGRAAGTYSVTVTDIHGCTVSGSYAVTQPAVFSVSGTVTNVSCYGGSDGGITTSLTGGTPGYTYLWNTGATTSGISGRTAGVYSVTVTDSHGCTAVGSYTITQPAVFSVAGAVTGVNCNGGSDGSIATTITGGTPGFTYLWSTGATTSGITGRPAATYSVTVTDSHGCTATGSYTVTQPAVLTVGGTVTNVSCFGLRDGSIASSVTGGTTPYSYLWNTGAVTANVSGLGAGNDTLKVTDAHGCITKATFTVTQPPALSCFISAHHGGHDITPDTVVYIGFGVHSIVLTDNVSGGTPGYTYSWYPDTGTGPTITVHPDTNTTYRVTATDSHGCTITCSITIYVHDIRCCTGHRDDCGRVYVCDGAHTSCVDTTIVDSLLSIGYTLGACHGHHKDISSETEQVSQVFSDAIRIYPNPMDGVFSVEIPAAERSAEIQVTDITGRVLETRTINDNKGEPQQFNLGNVTSGFYIVKVRAGDRFYISKLLKN